MRPERIEISDQARRLAGAATLEGILAAGSDVFEQRKEILASGIEMVEAPIQGIRARAAWLVRREIEAIKRVDAVRAAYIGAIAAGEIVLEELVNSRSKNSGSRS